MLFPKILFLVNVVNDAGVIRFQHMSSITLKVGADEVDTQILETAKEQARAEALGPQAKSTGHGGSPRNLSLEARIVHFQVLL